MADEISSNRERCSLAAAFALCAVASLTLLANHPRGGTGGLAILIKDEAAHQSIDGVVHGGFGITLVALVVCFVVLSRLLGFAKTPVIIGLVCFCTGCSALMASLALDGFAIPAMAVRFAGVDDLQPARTIFILLQSLIGLLMPTGLLFQLVAMIGWSSVIVKGAALRRAVGAFGLATAILLIVAIVAAPAGMAPHLALGGVILQSIWYLAIAALLLDRSSWPNSRRPQSEIVRILDPGNAQIL